MAPEIQPSDKFLEQASSVVSNVKDVVKTTNIDDKWVKIAEMGDSILKSIVQIITVRNNTSGNNNQGITNPNTANTTPQEEQIYHQNMNLQPQNQQIQQIQKLPEIEINYKIPQLYADLKKLLAEQQIINPDATLKSLLEDESFDKLINSPFIQEQIKLFIKNYTEVTIK